MATEAPAADVVETATEIEPEAGETSVDGAPKRKRSRRGTRGGRKRRKPAAANGAPAEADAATAVAADADVEPDAPEYVPMSKWIDDFDARERQAG